MERMERTDETPTDETRTGVPTGVPAAVWRPGEGMRFTHRFLWRYGAALERLAAGTDQRSLAVGAGAPAGRAPGGTRRVAPGTVARWVREAQERRAQRDRALAAGGRKPEGWAPPLTGAELTLRRKAAGLSQRDVAARAHVPRSSLSELERPRPGRQGAPEVWARVLDALKEAEAAG